MNHGVAWSSDSRKVRYRQRIESPVAGDMSLYDSSDYSSFLARECAEDHSTARNTRPFDIFLKKKIIGLKPSSLEQNREKRKTASNSFGNNKDLLQSPTSSSSKNIYLCGRSFVAREFEDKDGARMRCDLENRMKDVSLSRQESVSPTSDQKAELSSVEGHDNAKSENPCTVDRPLDESSGSRGRGSRGRGRSTTSFSPLHSSRRGNDEHSPVQPFCQKSNVVSLEQDRKSQEDIIGSAKQPDDGAASNKDLLKLSALSSSMNINFSGDSFVPSECEHNDVKDGARMRCDLENRMKDVSLSCQESVSPTSDQKAELSSVEGHDNACKSGGAGNSSNESSMRPFDLFLQKKGVGLKPSFMELNRAKRNAAKGYTGIVIRPGMVMIVNKCREMGLGEGGFYQPGYQDGGLLHLKMMCLGKHWDCETRLYGETRPVDGSTPPKIPVEFNQFVEKAIKESQSLAASNSKETKGEDKIPFMSTDICIVNFYSSTGRLGLHQDKGESEKSIRKGLPVVSFSIGDSAEFLYGDQRDNNKAEMVVLESGDVLLFGGKSRNVFHGVRSILKDTAPKVLVQETSLRPGRLNLTFRQY